jgi:hypothetical protein
VILFHGTSTSRANLIQEHGFQYPDFESEIEEISRRYEVGAEILRDQLMRLGRIVTSRDDDRKIYFSSHFQHAASYATRAPEFYWEALWAVYVIRNPELGLEWNQSDEGHAWVLSQMQSDPPVILHVEVSDHVLGQDADRIRGTREIMPPDSESGGAEVGLYPTSNLQIVDQTTGDYWIDGSLLRFLTDLSPEDLSQQVEDGVWGDSFSYQFTKYWLWRNIKARLNHRRLAELKLA